MARSAPAGARPCAVLRDLKRELGWRVRTGLRLARARTHSRTSVEKDFRARYFADRAVDLDGMRDYRLEAFPDSGPLPWLDLPDAAQRIAARLSRGEISAEEAQKCREWARSGVVVFERFFEAGELDRIWAAYEEAVRSGRVTLQPEKPAPGDALPSRSLDPHLAVPELRACFTTPA